MQTGGAADTLQKVNGLAAVEMNVQGRMTNTPSACLHQFPLLLLTRTCRGAARVWTAQDLKKEGEASSSSSPTVPPSPLTVSETRRTENDSCVSARLFLKESPLQRLPRLESPAPGDPPTTLPSRTHSSRPSV